MLGILEPGTPVPEMEVAERFHSSRAPVREAFIHLEKGGFLRAADYRGYSVPEISLQELKELFQVRLLLEPAAAEMAAKEPQLFRRQLEDCEAHISRQENEPVTPSTMLEHLKAEIGFHTLIARSGGNSLLAEVVVAVTERFQRYHAWLLRHSPSLTDTVKWHRQILDDIVNGRSEAARDAMSSHIQAGRQIWLERYFQH